MPAQRRSHPQKQKIRIRRRTKSRTPLWVTVGILFIMVIILGVAHLGSRKEIQRLRDCFAAQSEINMLRSEFFIIQINDLEAKQQGSSTLKRFSEKRRAEILQQLEELQSELESLQYE